MDLHLHEFTGNKLRDRGRIYQGGVDDHLTNDIKCLADLRTTDPRDDKIRIEDIKGGLLEDSYRWILEHSDFRQWRDDERSRLLWIKGDPGKGKTMLLCGIVNELSSGTRLQDKKANTLLSYFFCQAADERINSATAVLRGLIYLIVEQQPWLVSHIQKKYKHGGRALFTDVNAWTALSEIFSNILEDVSPKRAYVIIDALDECVTDLPKLLSFISMKSTLYSHVKWIVSSRSWPDDEERLSSATQQTRLYLDLNEKSISAPVNARIKHQAKQLTKKRYGNSTLENLFQDPALLLSAAKHGDIAAVRVFLEYVQPDVLDESGRTPLSWAAEKGHKAIVELLLDTDARSHLKDALGRTPLWYTTRNGHKAIVELLLGTEAAEADHSDANGLTLLLCAAKSGHEAIMQLLINRGANTESRDRDGRTPLSFAAEKGLEVIVKLLIDTGRVELDSKDNSGRTPMWYAIEKGHKSIAKLLSAQDVISVQNRTKNFGVMTSVEVKGEENPQDASSHSTQRIQPPTDSGYSSATHKTKLTQNILEGDLTDADDSRTVYSDTSSLPPLRKESYISELAKDLFDKTRSEEFGKDAMERVSRILPKLLKSFALKLGYNAPQMHRDVMFFVHRYRREIARSFNDRYSAEVQSLPYTYGSESDKMSLNEVMSLWDRNLDDVAYNAKPIESTFANVTDSWDGNLEDRKDDILDDDTYEASIADSTDRDFNEEVGDESQDSNMPHILAYKDLFLKSPAYDWLLASLHKEFFLAPAEPNTMETIKGQIIQSLPLSNKVSRKRSPDTYRMIFVLEWDPLKFINEQGYHEEPQEVVGTAITLTGSATDAQALTCSQYLCQTWPLTGEHIIKLVKDVVHSGAGHQHSCDLPDKTKLIARIHDANFIVEAFGTGDSIAEIGEQLAWLSAAFSPPICEYGVSYCTPFISDIQVKKLPDPQTKRSSSPEITCKINYIMQERKENFILSNGRCWYNLFRNPTVVTGYPIPRRSELDTGLEIPLNIMAGLARTQRVNTFNGNLFIKGFSTMLIPTKRNGDIVIWHLVCSPDRSRISYLENTVSHANNVGIFDLETTRHILGWCSEAACFAGAADGKYAVKPSRLRTVPKGGVYEKILYKGQLLTGSPFCIGLKDTPVRLSQGCYIDKLNWIHQKSVVLWDEEDKRGWLVNGTSALLHLILSCLENDSTGECSSKFLFKPEFLKYARETHKANSAIKVLQEQENLKLEIYQEKNDYMRLENRVEEFFDTLEKLIDYQIWATFHTDANPKRKHLEGWDYSDLARRQDTIRPRVARLQPAGKGWVDFTRSIHAITLFGRGFGEVIQPARNSLCAHWAKLPREKYYLAACVYDLKRIMNTNGSLDEKLDGGPMNLSGNIIWHNPDKIFEPCHCDGMSQGEHSDFVQVLLPSTFRSRILLENKPVELKGNDGAVIFGHNLSFNWHWKDQGDPEEGEPLSSPEESDSEFHDSGIGSGLRSSASFFRDSASQQVSNAAPINNLREKYTVGIVCALPKELMAVRMLLDNKHECPETPMEDTNHYVAGRIEQHNVVAACLPSGDYGTSSAASVVSNMMRSYTNISFYLLIGIGGGVPSSQNDIRLGDVVVSHPTGGHFGVIQYDFGKLLQSGTFEQTRPLKGRPNLLLTAISSLRSDPDLSSEHLLKNIAQIGKHKPKYKHPGVGNDKLFSAEYEHVPMQDTCSGCCGPIIKRQIRPTIERNGKIDHPPNIHYGLIASGNQVMKNARARDEIGNKYNVLCFEMEAAGVMNEVQCLVIRGICDYADSHKNDIWQEYAAASAAAYAKMLLSVVRAPNSADRVPTSLKITKRNSLRKEAAPAPLLEGGPSLKTSQQAGKPPSKRLRVFASKLVPKFLKRPKDQNT